MIVLTAGTYSGLNGSAVDDETPAAFSGISDILSCCKLSWQGHGGNGGTKVTSYCDVWWRGREGMGKTGCAVYKETKQPLPFGINAGKDANIFFFLFFFLPLSFLAAY